MKKKKIYLLALALAGMSLTACGGSSIGLNYDESDLEIDTEWVEYSVPVTSVTFDEGEDSIVVERGKTYEYSYSIEPKKAVKRSLSWSSSNTDIATVDKGVVTGVSAGKTVVSVFNNENSFNPIYLDVEVIVPVTDIAFRQSTLLADYYTDYELIVDYSPFDTTEKGLSWSIDNEEIATIDQDGFLKTKGVTGVVTVSAHSAYINKVITLTVDVADRTVYPDAVQIDEFESEVEVGKNFTMTAHSYVSSDPTAMVTHPEVKYYSSDPTILSVEEDTGIVHALGVGNASIYATANGKTQVISSPSQTVHVFEVKVQTIVLEDITLSNRNGRSDVPVGLTYTTDTAGYDVASVPNFKYTIGDENVATVNDNGMLRAVAPSGSTTLRVDETRSGVTKTVNVYVGYEVDSIVVNGTSEIDTGRSMTLSVTTSPSGFPASLISYSSSNDSVATVNSDGVVTGVSDGTATITVTATGMNKTVTETFEVKVNIPEIPFSYDMSYVVGDHDYYSGVSKPSSTGSWDKANQAKAVDEVVQAPHDTLLYERRAVVKFNAGDIWKLRTAEEYLPTDGYKEGLGYLIGEYKTKEGAFVGSNPDMSITGDDYKNVLVNRTGYYAIYHAQYTNDHPEGWFSIYVARHELTLSDTTPQIQVGTSVVLEAHNWLGELSHNVSEGSELISVVRGTGADNYKFTVTAGSTSGTAKIVFTDEWKSVEVLVTVSTDAPLPKTFEDGIPYVVGNADYHTGTAVGSGEYWGSDASKAMKCVVSSGEIDPQDVYAQFETTITFAKDNQFKVVIGGESLYWDAAYEKAGAIAKGQMSQPDNVVVNEEGTYKIYVKCLTNNRGWSVYIEPKQGGGDDPTDVPAEDGYYLVGSETNFKYEGATKMSAGTGGNLAQLIGYEAHAGEEFKVRGYHSGVDTWYNWGNAPEADPGANYAVGATAKTVDVYLNGEGLFYVADHVTPSTDVPSEDGYYLVSSKSNFKYDGATKMSAGDGTDLAKLIGYEASANEEFKVRGYHSGVDTWYNWGNAPEADPGANYAVGATAKTLDIYLNSEGKFYVAEHVEHTYYLTGTFLTPIWKIDDNYILVQDSENPNKYTLSGLEFTAGQNIKVNDPSLGDDGWYGVESTYADCHYTVGDDYNCVVATTGTYDVEFYFDAIGGNHIKLILKSSPTPPTPVTEKTVSIQATVAQTDGAWIGLWAWNTGEDGKFYFATEGGYDHGGTWTFTLPSDVDNMIILRMASGAEVSDVTKWPSGSVWNQSGNISITGTVYTLTSIMDGHWTA